MAVDFSFESTFMRLRNFVLCVSIFFLSVEIRSLAADTTYVRFNTTLGNIDVQLLSDEAPLTVANFLQYVDHSDYSNSFFHRSISGFIIQGGGFNIPSDNSIGSVDN